MKRIIALTISIMLLQSVSFASGETITVHNTKDAGLYMSIGNKRVDLGEAKIFIDENERTQLPVRAVSELLNASVDWDDSTKTVTIQRDDNVIHLEIGSDIMYRNNDPIKMDTAAVIVDDKTYIPLRYIGEALGCLVVYTDGNTPFHGQLHDGVDEDFYNSMQ